MTTRYEIATRISGVKRSLRADRIANKSGVEGKTLGDALDRIKGILNSMQTEIDQLRVDVDQLRADVNGLLRGGG